MRTGAIMGAEHYLVVRFRDLIEAAPQMLPLGAHLISPRLGYLHHGIYIGCGNVIHYSGSTYGLQRGPVEQVSLDQFACSCPLWVRSRTRDDFVPSEVVRRARSRLGEDGYSVFSNNCEHFCEWCQYGEHHSHQVEALRALPGAVLKSGLRLIGRLISKCHVITDGAPGYRLTR
jgi:lecithin:retinol acyltransferase